MLLVRGLLSTLSRRVLLGRSVGRYEGMGKRYIGGVSISHSIASIQSSSVAQEGITIIQILDLQAFRNLLMGC